MGYRFQIVKVSVRAACPQSPQLQPGGPSPALPNTLTATINHERSPVLLTVEEQLATWLTGTPKEAFGLIKTSDPERMQIVQSGFEKKDLQQAA
jgi:hypothetical protein